MTSARRTFLQQAILVIAVVVPLALAERVWWYLAVVTLSVAVGWWTLIRGRRPLLGPVGSRVFVLAAFGLLLVEYVWLISIPVVALSHFMMLVCGSKFLQERTLRDDAQLAVLSLLLLVVAAIISGNVLFLGVVLIYLTVGLDLLIRFWLSLERLGVERANLSIQPSGATTIGRTTAGLPVGSVIMAVAPLSMIFGVALFTFFPRIGAGMFGRADTSGGGLAVTGFSTVISFDTVGPIAESERQIMRVQVEAESGPPLTTREPLYLRGRVYDFYTIRRPGGRGWDWRRSQRPRMRIVEEADIDRVEFNLLPGYRPDVNDQILRQQYTLEPGANSDSVLFSIYPALEISAIGSDEVEAVAKTYDDGSLRTSRPVGKLLRYTILSAGALSPGVVQALEAERERAHISEPRARAPDPPLPRTNELRELLEPLMAGIGPLDVPANRIQFAERLTDWLRSREFTYTLSPPVLRSGEEPVSTFLLEHRKGYCQHFASAMTILCQLAGVPARLVSGFRCDDYNEIGRFYSVRGKHAHAWVEVYIPGRDWVLFDPTPGGGSDQVVGTGLLAQLRGYVDYLQFQWSSLVLAYDADTRRNLLARFGEWLRRPARHESTVIGTVAAFVYELFAWRLQMSWRDRLLYWVFALLIVALSVGIGYIVTVLSWRGGNRLAHVVGRRWPGRKAGDAIFYHRLCRRLSGLGFRRRSDQTPAEFVTELAGRYAVLAPAVEMVSAYYEIVYGRRSLSPERRMMFDAFLQQLERLDRGALQAGE